LGIMTHSFITECIVLKSKSYKEADKIFTLFTKSEGKINAIAKGVKKPISRKAGSLDVFDYSRVALSEWKDFFIITQAEIINPFSELKNDLVNQGFLYLIGETLDKLLPYREEYAGLFVKMPAKLEELSKCGKKQEVLIETLIMMLLEMGYWSANFPRDLEYIKGYIESLTDNKLGSANLIDKITKIGVRPHFRL